MELDLEAMLADHMEWAAKTLKKRNRFHQCAFVMAPRSAVQELARFPTAQTMKLHDATNPRPEDLAILYVLAEFTPEGTVNRLKDLASLRGNADQMKALAMMEGMMKMVGLTPEAAFRAAGTALARHHGYSDPEDFAKDVFMEHMREMTRVTRAIAVIMVMEAYYLEGVDPKDRPRSLKNDPRSKEMLWGVLVTPNTPPRGASMKVHRAKPHTGKVLHISKMERSDGGASGRFTEFFDKDATVSA